MSVDKFGRSTNKFQRVIVGPAGPPGNGFKRTENGDFDIEGKRLRNIKSPTTPDEAVNKAYIDDKLENKEKILRDYIDIQNLNTIRLLDDLRKYFLLQIGKLKENQEGEPNIFI